MPPLRNNIVTGRTIIGTTEDNLLLGTRAKNSSIPLSPIDSPLRVHTNLLNPGWVRFSKKTGGISLAQTHTIFVHGKPVLHPCQTGNECSCDGTCIGDQNPNFTKRKQTIATTLGSDQPGGTGGGKVCYTDIWVDDYSGCPNGVYNPLLCPGGYTVKVPIACPDDGNNGLGGFGLDPTGGGFRPSGGGSMDPDDKNTNKKDGTKVPIIITSKTKLLKFKGTKFELPDWNDNDLGSKRDATKTSSTSNYLKELNEKKKQLTSDTNELKEILNQLKTSTKEDNQSDLNKLIDLILILLQIALRNLPKTPQTPGSDWDPDAIDAERKRTSLNLELDRISSSLLELLSKLNNDPNFFLPGISNTDLRKMLMSGLSDLADIRSEIAGLNLNRGKRYK
ncbi:MAG: hypothetical protein WCH46_08170 [bacterium]